MVERLQCEASSGQPWRLGEERLSYQAQRQDFGGTALRFLPTKAGSLPSVGQGGEGGKNEGFMLRDSGGRRRGDSNVASLTSDISSASLPALSQDEGKPLICFGSSSSTTFLWRHDVVQLPKLMIVGQTLPPWSPRGRQEVIFLQAQMPIQRIFDTKTASSYCFAKWHSP
jgi:hypothetical protein